MIRWPSLIVFLLALAWGDLNLGDAECPCNPRVDRDCFSVNQALGTAIFETFDTLPVFFSSSSFPQNVECLVQFGMRLTIRERFQYPTVKSNFYLMYGKISAEVKASYGVGIVSSFYLQSDDLDEIDIMESLGSDLAQVQTNYFVKGNTSNYDRGIYHFLEGPQNTYHSYTLEWTPSKISWYQDEKLVREVHPTAKDGYPTSPMKVVFGIWAGGDQENEEGTILWSGGLTDYKECPFDMYVKNVQVKDYSTGDHYVYGNAEGKWLRVSSRGGEIFEQEGKGEVWTELTKEQQKAYEGDNSDKTSEYLEIEEALDSGLAVPDRTEKEEEDREEREKGNLPQYHPQNFEESRSFIQFPVPRSSSGKRHASISLLLLSVVAVLSFLAPSSW